MNREDRIEGVRHRMAAEGVDLLIAASNGRHTLDRADPVVHLSGYRSLAESVFLLDRDGAAGLLVSPATDAERVAAQLIGSSVIATDDLAKTLDAEWSKYASIPGRTAIAGIDSLPYRLAEKLQSLAGPAARPFDQILLAVQGPKSSAEIARMKRATEIAEEGFVRLLEIARVGMTETELAVELNCYAKSLGADDNFLMLCASPHNSAVMPSSSRKLQPGDILLTEFSPCFEGQFSQICRTISIGAPRRELQGKYDLVIRAMRAGIKTVGPGVPVSQICRAIDEVMASAGYAEYCHPPHLRRRGHGLGSGSVAPGDIAPDNQTLLEENMCFVVHPNQYLPEVGYLLCGEPVRVTSTGIEILSSRGAALEAIGIAQTGSAPCS